MGRGKIIGMNGFSATCTAIGELLLSRPRASLDETGLIPSAVLILLVDRSDVPSVLITRRSQAVATHRGDMAFPGGIREAADSDLAATALRETEEETGLPAENIGLLGRFDDYRSIKGHHVAVFAGFYKGIPDYRFNGEIDHHVEVPFQRFLDENYDRSGTREFLGKLYDMYEYDIDGGTIWGLTGRIITDFARAVKAYELLSSKA